MSTASPKKNHVGLLIVVVVLAAACIPCTGILAAIAIPSFIGYVRKSKTAEAETNLRTIYAAASSYYDQDRVGPDGTLHTRCTVDPDITLNAPTSERQFLGPLGPSFTELGFLPPDPVLFQYEIVAGPSRCDHGPDEVLYTFRARGDLDGDGITSSFELTVGSDGSNRIYRSPGLFIDNELE